MIRGLLTLLMLALAPLASAQARFEFDASIYLRSNDPAFGGFSAIHVFDGGTRSIVLSDRGHILTGDLIRDNGQLTDVTFAPLLPILDSKGVPLDARNTDAEGLAVGSDGALYISFESNHRVMRHDAVDSAATFLPKHPDFRTLQGNSGLEALAIDAAGTIYAIPERSGGLDVAFPVYRFRNGAWDKRLQIERLSPYLVSGADVFEGYLYVLERHLAGLPGFSTRIRRFSLDDLTTGEVLLTSRYGRFDNLEGISVWRDETGSIHATLISDNNFNFFQRNQIVEFILRE